MDTGDCQPLYHAIRDYYEGMNMRIDQQIPMLLVERQALNEAIVGEKNVTLVFLNLLLFNFIFFICQSLNLMIGCILGLSSHARNQRFMSF